MSWLVFVIISIGLYFGARYLLPELFLGEQPKVIYKDTGNAKIFRNKKFRVEGKPDAILLTRVGYIAEEFKSRKRLRLEVNIQFRRFPSGIKQSKKLFYYRHLTRHCLMTLRSTIIWLPEQNRSYYLPELTL